MQSWNATVEQQLAGSWLVSASYIGTNSERLWNTTAINGAIFLTPQSHPSLFTGPDTCVLEGVTFTPCNSTANINQRRELRLWAAQNNPALLADAALFANIDEIPVRQHLELPRPAAVGARFASAVSTSTRTTRCRAA